MRLKSQKQLYFKPQSPNIPLSKELLVISQLLESLPEHEEVLEKVMEDLNPGNSRSSKGRKGMTSFEPHTDIIVKRQRDIVFGHKGTITTGRSGMILDIHIHNGNPSDASLVRKVLNGHKEFYDTAPESMVFDGCYNSEDNRRLLLGEGVKYLTFSKESDIKATCSRAVRKALRFFRAGIEATVSMLKRMFGWTRVMDKGPESFCKALKTGAIAYNLFILSRISLKNSA